MFSYVGYCRKVLKACKPVLSRLRGILDCVCCAVFCGIDYGVGFRAGKPAVFGGFFGEKVVGFLVVFLAVFFRQKLKKLWYDAVIPWQGCFLTVALWGVSARTVRVCQHAQA